MTSTQKTWIILASDGRHVSIGRQTDPTEGDLDAAAASLKQLGLGGWVAVMEGRYHSTQLPKLRDVRMLAMGGTSWAQAVHLFEHFWEDSQERNA